MKAQWAWSLGVSLLSTSASLAQVPDQASPQPGPGSAPPPAQVRTAPVTAAAACNCQPCPEPPRFFAGVEYLVWQVKGQPVPVPIVTTSSNASFGILDRADTLILAGNGTLGFNWISGVRVTGGYVLDPEDEWTLEGGLYFIFRKESRQRVATDANGEPLLAVPFRDAITGTEVSLIYAVPGLFTGSIDFGGGTRFTSGEVNLAIPVSQSQRWRFDVLMGQRYADLHENLDIRSQTTILPGGPTFNVAGFTVNPEDTVGDINDFRTRNQLFALQVGTRAIYTVGDGLFLTGTAKCAVGLNRQTLDINGVTFIQRAAGGPPTTIFGGLWAVGPNIRREVNTQPAFLPEMSLMVGYWMTDSICLTAGYQIVYFSRVMRPGNQLDRVINRSYVPQSAAYGGPAEPFRPAVPFSRTDFWAQGLAFGLEIRF